MRELSWVIDMPKFILEVNGRAKVKSQSPRFHGCELCFASVKHVKQEEEEKGGRNETQ